jgi:hypothetical protein
MKRTVLLAAAFLSAAGGSLVCAESPKNMGPEVINLKMGVMIAPFQHRKHQKRLNNECWHCHKTADGVIDGWGKLTAHTICIPCHDLEEKGPTECRQCHKKSLTGK